VELKEGDKVVTGRLGVVVKPNIQMGPGGGNRQGGPGGGGRGQM